jgi:nucleotide-binding universal stress UspA family protein
MSYGGMDVPEQWIAQMSESRQRLTDRSDAVMTLLKNEGVSGGVQPVQTVLADIPAIVGRRAQVSDLAFLAPNLRTDNADLFRSAAHGILFHSPVALMLNGAPLSPPERVFVAWNTDLPAARAVHEALPMLKAAKEVVIGCIDPDATATRDGEDPGSDLAEWLSHLGCTVVVNQYPSGGKDIGEGIQRHATELGADLVVMGAFGRSRLREFVFGGTTRTMLDQVAMPVFMAR